MSALGDVAGALDRMSRAADRAVFLAEAVLVHLGIVIPEDVGMEYVDEDEETDD